MPNITYTHRNGETEPPTIEGAYFWFFGKYEAEQPFGMFFVTDSLVWMPDSSTAPISELDGRWWGPVEAPWGGSNA